MDKNRRKFLKILLIGGGTLLVGKIMGPLFSKSLDNSVSITPDSSDSKKDSTPFKLAEDEKSLSVYDEAGEEIFQIDKGV